MTIIGNRLANIEIDHCLLPKCKSLLRRPLIQSEQALFGPGLHDASRLYSPIAPILSMTTDMTSSPDAVTSTLLTMASIWDSNSAFS